VIVPRPPVRAFALAAVLALAGAGALIITSEGWLRTMLIVVGIALVVLAVLLLALALAGVRRQRVTVHLDDAGYRVDSPAGVRSGAWADVTRVTTAPGRITLHQGDAERVHLVAPNGQVPQFEAIEQAISKHLDADRGYTIWEG